HRALCPDQRNAAAKFANRVCASIAAPLWRGTSLWKGRLVSFIRAFGSALHGHRCFRPTETGRLGRQHVSRIAEAPSERSPPRIVVPHTSIVGMKLVG